MAASVAAAAGNSPHIAHFTKHRLRLTSAQLDPPTAALGDAVLLAVSAEQVLRAGKRHRLETCLHTYEEASSSLQAPTGYRLILTRHPLTRTRLGRTSGRGVFEACTTRAPQVRATVQGRCEPADLAASHPSSPTWKAAASIARPKLKLMPLCCRAMPTQERQARHGCRCGLGWLGDNVGGCWRAAAWPCAFCGLARMHG